MTEHNERPSRPLSDRHKPARHTSAPHRNHRGVHQRHGYVFGFPLCSATELDEFLGDAGPTNR